MRKLALAIMLTICLGCGDGNQERREESESAQDSILQMGRLADIIMPLAVGNMWVFQVNALDTSVNAMRRIGIDTFRVVRDTTIANSRWYELRGLQSDGYAINWTNGCWFAVPGSDPFLFAKYPAAVGDTFTSVIGGVEARYQVVATGAEITVPAGRFFCYHYRQRIGPRGPTSNYYFAPGVGLVKLEIFDPGGRKIAENLLLEVTGK